MLKNVIKRVLSAEKRSISFIFFSVLILPLLQITGIYIMYLMIDPGKQLLVKESILGYQLPDSINSLILSLNFSVILFILSLVIMAIYSILKYTSDMSLIKLTYNLYIHDSLSILKKLLRVSPQKFKKIGFDKLTSNIINDVGSFGVLVKVFINLSSAVTMVIVYLFLAFFLSFKMTIIALIVALFPLLMSRKLFLIMKDVGRKKVAANEKIIGFFNDYLRGYDRIKLDALEEDFLQRATPVLRQSQQWRVLKRKTESQIEILTTNMSLVSITTILFFGSAVLSIDLPLLLILLVIFNQLRGNVNIISAKYARIQEVQPSIERYYKLIDSFGNSDELLLEYDYDNSLELGLKTIRSENVSFSHSDNSLLSNIDFSAVKGDRILIQGASGQGKTSFIELIAGLLAPDNGAFYYDNFELNNNTFEKLRHKSIFISPEVYLFNVSLRENLLIGKTNISEKKLKLALTYACLDNLVDELPDGIDSNIGVNGNALSLGQRQRVILARLFLEQPKLILLDEVTANLDLELESKIMENIYSYIDKDSILILISHRTPLGADFNKSYKLNDGTLDFHDTSSL
jgi:ABC-type multidrug transport system fused ATPase/permease subunit